MHVYVVQEVNADFSIADKPADGYFSNFEAAEAYVRDTFTPHYERFMMISKCTMNDSWPLDLNTYEHPENYHYHQLDGQVVRREKPDPILVIQTEYGQTMLG